MKKLFFALLSGSLTLSGFSQSIPTQLTSIQTDYLKKSKHQKTAAWILVSSGVFFSILGSIELNFAGTESGKTSNNTFFQVLGLTAVGVSIPFFVSAAKNKKKAMSLSFKNGMTPQIYKSGFVYKPVPSLTLKIGL